MVAFLSGSTSSALNMTTAVEAFQAIEELSTEKDGKVDKDGNAIAPKRHWSPRVLIASAVVSTVAAVAAIFFGQIAFAVGFVAAACSQLMGAYYIKQFYPLKTMENLEEHFKQQNEKFDASHKELKKEVVDISKATDTLKDEVKEDAELVQKYQELLGLKQNLEKQTNDLQKALKDTTTTLEAQQAQNKVLQDTVDVLTKNLENVKDAEVKLDHETIHLAESIVEFKEIIAHESDAKEQIAEDIKSVEEKTQKYQNILQASDLAMKKQIHDLEVDGEGLVKVAEGIKHIAKDMQSTHDDNQAIIAESKKVNLSLEAILKLYKPPKA